MICKTIGSALIWEANIKLQRLSPSCCKMGPVSLTSLQCAYYNIIQNLGKIGWYLAYSKQKFKTKLDLKIMLYNNTIPTIQSIDTCIKGRSAHNSNNVIMSTLQRKSIRDKQDSDVSLTLHLIGACESKCPLGYMEFKLAGKLDRQICEAFHTSDFPILIPMTHANCYNLAHPFLISIAVQTFNKNPLCAMDHCHIDIDRFSGNKFFQKNIEVKKVDKCMQFIPTCNASSKQPWIRPSQRKKEVYQKQNLCKVDEQNGARKPKLISWLQAEQICKRRNGSLPSFNSIYELNMFLIKLQSRWYTKKYHMNMYQPFFCDHNVYYEVAVYIALRKQVFV